MKMIKNFDQFNLIEESATYSETVDFINDFGFLITLNLSKISSYAKDDKSKAELITMQQVLRNPIINGKNYAELLNDIQSIIKNPKFLSALLLQIKKLLEYIEPRIVTFVVDGEIKDKWIDRIKKLKETYLKIIKD